MKLSNFTLESLGLKGNYLVTINYIESNEKQSEFYEFLNKQNTLHRKADERHSFLEIKKELSVNFLSLIKNESSVVNANYSSPINKETSVEVPSNAVKIDEISYDAFYQSKDSMPARNSLKLWIFI